MKRWSAYVAGACLLTLAGFGARAEVVDGVVATVGTEVILHSELVQGIATYLSDLQKTASSGEVFEQKAQAKLREALDQAIDNKILVREALLAGIDVKKERVEEQIGTIKKRFASNDEFEKEMQAAGDTMSEFRERVKKQMLAITMATRKREQFEKEASVSEADMTQYYKDHQDKYAHPERVRLRRIFLEAKSDAARRAEAHAKLDVLKKQIDGGADFAELAKKNSAGPEAERGGLMDWTTRKDLVKEIADVVFALPEGGVSNVVDTEFGVVLFKVDKKEEAGTTMLDEARSKIEPELRAKFAEEKFTQWMSELRKRSRVRIFLTS